MLKLNEMREKYNYTNNNGEISYTIGTTVYKETAATLQGAAARIAPQFKTVFLPDAIGDERVVAWLNARADEIAIRAHLDDIYNKITNKLGTKTDGVTKQAATLELHVFLYLLFDSDFAGRIAKALETDKVANKYDAKIINVVAFAKSKKVGCPFTSDALYNAYTDKGVKKSEKLRTLRTLHKWLASGYTAESVCAPIVTDCKNADVSQMETILIDGYKLNKSGMMELANKREKAMAYQFNAYLLNMVQHFTKDEEREKKVRETWEAENIPDELPKIEKKDNKTTKKAA